METIKVKQPIISVIMPVYNAGNHLETALKSILSQSFTNFELIIINDGSTDNAISIIPELNDERIRLINNSKNLGLIASLNVGLKNVNGEFIARMDQDDIALNHRFERQLEILNNNNNIGVVGCWVKRFGAEDKIVKYPEKNAEIKTAMFFYNPISHPSVLFRKSIIDSQDFHYHKDYLDAEDYHLWFQLFKYTEFYNIPEVLLNYRVHEGQMGFIAPQASLDSTRKIKKEALRLFGNSFTTEEEDEWLNIVYNNPSHNETTILTIEKIIKANQVQNVVDESILVRKLTNSWKNSFIETKRFSEKTSLLFRSSPLRKHVKFSLKQQLVLYKKLLLN